jgi:hypothetical protein
MGSHCILWQAITIPESLGQGRYDLVDSGTWINLVARIACLLIQYAPSHFQQPCLMGRNTGKLLAGGACGPLVTFLGRRQHTPLWAGESEGRYPHLRRRLSRPVTFRFRLAKQPPHAFSWSAMECLESCFLALRSHPWMPTIYRGWDSLPT